MGCLDNRRYDAIRSHWIDQELSTELTEYGIQDSPCTADESFTCTTKVADSRIHVEVASLM